MFIEKNKRRFSCAPQNAAAVFKSHGVLKIKQADKHAIRKSDDFPAAIAAFAEPLACLDNGKNKIPVSPGDRVRVMGADATGLLFAQIMKACGACPVIVSKPAEM